MAQIEVTEEEFKRIVDTGGGVLLQDRYGLNMYVIGDLVCIEVSGIGNKENVTQSTDDPI